MGPVWFLDADAKLLPVAPVFNASGVCLGSSQLSLGPVPTISRTVIRFATVNTDWWSQSTFVGSTHVGWVCGYPTEITEIVIWTISAPVATFATSRTYNSVLWWVRRLSSRTCICQCLLWLGSTLAFAICRCFGGSIGVIAFQWILVVCVWFGDWESLWWSSSLCCGCCRGWSLWLVTCRPWKMALGTPFSVISWSVENGCSPCCLPRMMTVVVVQLCYLLLVGWIFLGRVCL